MSLLIREYISDAATAFLQFFTDTGEVCFTSIYLSARLADLEYANEMKYDKLSERALISMPAIEFSDLLVSLHVKLFIKFALEFEILAGKVIRGKNPLATSISKKSLTKPFSSILIKSIFIAPPIMIS